MSLPTQDGHFGKFGGRFVPEALQAALTELTEDFEEAQADPSFHAELARLQRDYAIAPRLPAPALWSVRCWLRKWVICRA